MNPSLWRQSQLVAKQGLYKVVDGIYQVRGLDLSNVTFIEGDEGVIVIDTLLTKGDRGCGAGPVPRASRGAAGQGDHLHPFACRPLRAG